MIQFGSEDQLIEALSSSRVYKDFHTNQLQHKIDRERRAWKLLEEHKGQYTEEILNRIFDTVDFYETNKRWLGQLLAPPNRNLIFESSPDRINKWLTELLFSGRDPETALNTCLTKLRIKGASKGLATLLLYLSNPQTHNIWVNTTQEGLFLLNRIKELKSSDWGANYIQFNKAAIKFRNKFSLLPQEIDWILTFIASYVESVDDHFSIEEDLLKTEEVPISVDDETDLDDIVGKPMELGVMRWTPTNEMGVVALFIEHRKELGFPLIEFIRTKFPDAAVFENSSKGYIRRYIEFEFKSSGFKAHLKSKRKCHYVVCWEHDWKDCPVPVRELKREIPVILSDAVKDRKVSTR